MEEDLWLFRHQAEEEQEQEAAATVYSSLQQTAWCDPTRYVSCLEVKAHE
jgi:hypothetical protein